jgi:hypothetical protein
MRAHPGEQIVHVIAGTLEYEIGGVNIRQHALGPACATACLDADQQAQIAKDTGSIGPISGALTFSTASRSPTRTLAYIRTWLLASDNHKRHNMKPMGRFTGVTYQGVSYANSRTIGRGSSSNILSIGPGRRTAVDPKIEARKVAMQAELSPGRSVLAASSGTELGGVLAPAQIMEWQRPGKSIRGEQTVSVRHVWDGVCKREIAWLASLVGGISIAGVTLAVILVQL